jgi:hypothetical protein
MVCVLKELNQLASGEIQFYVEVYSNDDKAVVAMKEQTESYVEEYNATIVSESPESVELRDPKGNKYKFSIDTVEIK